MELIFGIDIQKVLYFLHLGQRKELVYSKGRKNPHIYKKLNRRQQLGQLNRHQNTTRTQWHSTN